MLKLIGLFLKNFLKEVLEEVFCEKPMDDPHFIGKQST